jgi:uncharacterized protein YqfA (UPF0365 family)
MMAQFAHALAGGSVDTLLDAATAAEELYITLAARRSATSQCIEFVPGCKGET